jgi:hypothetical protein
MESMDGYLERKFREIALLNDCLASPATLRRPVSAVDAIETKFRLAAAIKAEQVKRNWSATETARIPAPHAANGAFEFSYGYQRADLAVDGPPIYPLLDATAAGFAAETIYTSSGMSALAALFTALATLHDRVELLVPPGCYGETRELLGRFRGRFHTVPLDVGPRPTGSPRALRALLLDSSLRGRRRYLLPVPVRDIDLAIFDTTCYWRNSARIRRTIRWAAQAHIPLVLVRSHAKLDCLGVEYGRLGSVVVAVPAGLAASRSARVREGLAHETREAVRLLGAAPTPANFPPFAGAPQFSRCSAGRIAAIIGNNRRMSRTLSRALGGPRVVGEFQHGLYLTLAPERDLSVEEASDAAASLCREAASSPVPIAHAGSFGFDFLAIEWFADPLLERNVIRVAVSDVPPSSLDALTSAIIRWWPRHAHAAPRIAGSDQLCGLPV